MEKYAERYCKSCYGCQLTSRPYPPESIRTTTLLTGPWRDLAVDLMGPLPSGKSILVVVNYYSRYYEADVLKSTTAPKIISSLEEIFSRHGLPESLTSDNGPQFISAEFAEYMDNQGTRHHRTTAKWPQANGEVERQNQSLLKRIQIAHAENKDWKKELNTYLIAYRSLPHPTTGVSPAELLFGRKIRTKLPELSDIHVDQEVRDKDSEEKSRGKAYADAKRNACYSDVLPGDQVLVQEEKKTKLSTPFNPTPYLVVSKHGNSLVVQSQDGARYSRDTSHVKKLQHSETKEETQKPPVETNEEAQKPPVEPKEQTQQDMEEQAEQETDSPIPSTPFRRSERQRVTPSYLKDYVT